MDKLPVYSVDLVKELDRIYPSKLPTIDMTDRQIWITVGQRMVVDSLLTHIQSDGDEQDIPQLLNKD